MLSQLKQNETLIRELQGRAENGVSGVLGEQMTSDPGSSSLRGYVTQPSMGQEVVNPTMSGAPRALRTELTQQGSVPHPSSQDKLGISTNADVGGSSVDERGRKRQRGKTWSSRRHRISQSGSSESPVSVRDKRRCKIGHVKARSVKSMSSHSPNSTSESSSDNSDDDSDESPDDELESLDSSFQTGV